MTEAKHTPGPWAYIKAERLSHDAPEIGPVVSHGGILGGPSDDLTWIIEGEIDYAPNAHLIVAAPDMLDALRQWKAAETMKDFAELRNAKISRDEAIAKATGVA